MNNRVKKTVTYFHYEDDIVISLQYPEGGCVGELTIVNTPLGFQLKAYYDSWKIFSSCTDLFELLGSQSMAGVTMKQLAEMIKDIGYELDIR